MAYTSRLPPPSYTLPALWSRLKGSAPHAVPLHQRRELLRSWWENRQELDSSERQEVEEYLHRCGYPVAPPEPKTVKQQYRELIAGAGKTEEQVRAETRALVESMEEWLPPEQMQVVRWGVDKFFTREEEPRPTPTNGLAEIVRRSPLEADPLFESLIKRLAPHGAKVKVAILDAGFWESPHFERRVNFSHLVNHPMPGEGEARDDFHDEITNSLKELGAAHGTATSDIASAKSKRVVVSPHQVIESVISFTEKTLVPAIGAAIAQGNTLINLSLGSLRQGEDCPDILEAMRRHPDVLFVWAAGNGGRSLEAQSKMMGAMFNPKASEQTDSSNWRPWAMHKLSNSVVVAGSNLMGGPWEQSDRDAEFVRLAVPAEQVFALQNSDHFGYNSGTSFAAPYAIQVAASCSALGVKSPEKLIRILTDTSDHHPDWNGVVAAGGTINKERAMCLAALISLVEQRLRSAAWRKRRFEGIVDRCLRELRISTNEQAKLKSWVKAYFPQENRTEPVTVGLGRACSATSI